MEVARCKKGDYFGGELLLFFLACTKINAIALYILGCTKCNATAV